MMNVGSKCDDDDIIGKKIAKCDDTIDRIMMMNDDKRWAYKKGIDWLDQSL